jgi:tetratricopeptide (TPR) repeat protein
VSLESDTPPPRHKPSIELTRPQRTARRRGGLFVLIAVVLGVGASMWWLMTPARPPTPATESATEQPLPHVEPGRFTAAVTHFAGDADNQQAQLIVNALRGVGDGRAVQFDRTIRVDDGALATDHDTARQLLAQSGASVLIWGSLATREGEMSPDLYWTLAAELQDGGRWGRYQPPVMLHLPLIGSSDLADLLRLLVIAQTAEFHANEGGAMDDPFPAILDRVRGFAYGSRQRPGMTKRARIEVQFVLAYVLAAYGEQTQQTKLAQEAVTLYRELLAGRPADAEPLRWAMLQNNLANALWMVGEHEIELPVQRANLERALAVLQSALIEVSRERTPLAWAMIESNLGIVLTSLGVRQVGPIRLEAAAAAFRAALQERTRAQGPYAFALTQTKLGDALRELGTRTKQAAVVCRAVDSHLEAWQALTAAGQPPATRVTAAADAIARDFAAMKESFSARDVEDCRAVHSAGMQQLERGAST